MGEAGYKKAKEFWHARQLKRKERQRRIEVRSTQNACSQQSPRVAAACGLTVTRAGWESPKLDFARPVKKGEERSEENDGDDESTVASSADHREFQESEGGQGFGGASGRSSWSSKGRRSLTAMRENLTKKRESLKRSLLQKKGSVAY